MSVEYRYDQQRGKANSSILGRVSVHCFPRHSRSDCHLVDVPVVAWKWQDSLVNATSRSDPSSFSETSVTSKALFSCIAFALGITWLRLIHPHIAPTEAQTGLLDHSTFFDFLLVEMPVFLLVVVTADVIAVVKGRFRPRFSLLLTASLIVFVPGFAMDLFTVSRSRTAEVWAELCFAVVASS